MSNVTSTDIIEIPFPEVLPWGEWESKEQEEDYWSEDISGDR
jgi:hypothetical protein